MTARPAAFAAPVQRPAGRSFLLDLLKACGCLLIVLHHLAFYGPMADVVASVWPTAVDWLARHARLAVQVFLVCSGFLSAQSLASMPSLSWRDLLHVGSRRYLRLAVPLLAALSLTVLISEAIRPAFAHASLSAPPNWAQAVAHLALVQHLLGMEALSAGVWYVAVDLQLFVLALAVLWLAQHAARRGWGRAWAWQAVLTVVLVVFSLIHWTHDARLEDTALYFWGAYGMGWMAWHARSSPSQLRRWAGLMALGALCLIFDERARALVAWATAAWLMVAPGQWFASASGQPAGPSRLWARCVSWLSRISYAVFVVHFGVCLLVNFVVQRHWPQSVAANGLGMLLALALSLLAGQCLHRWTEQGAPSWSRWLAWASAFMASSGMAMWLSR